MNKFKVLVIIMLMFMLTGCYFDSSNINKDSNYDIYSAKKIITNEGSEESGTLNLCVQNFEKLNPLNPESKYNANINNLLFAKLFEIDKDFNIKKQLVDEYSFDAEHKSLTISIIKNAKWSDGTLISSMDIEYTLKMISGYNNGYYEMCKNSIDAVVRVDDRTVKILLKTDDLQVLYHLAIPILPKSEQNGNIKYSGAFRVLSEDDEKFLLVKNPYWYNKVADEKDNMKIAKINIYKYNSRSTMLTDFNMKKLDLIYVPDLLAGTFKNRTDIKEFLFPSEGYEMLVFNHKGKMLEDPVINDILYRSIMNGDIFKDINTENIKIIRIPVFKDVDIDNVVVNELTDDDKKIINKATYASKTIKILFNTENRNRRLIANSLKTALESAGFYVTLLPYEYSAYVSAIRSGNYSIVLMGQNIDYEPLPERVYNPFAKIFFDINAQVVTINTGYDNTRLYEAGINYLYNLDNQVYLNSITDIIDKELPYLGLYFKMDGIAVSERVKGNIDPISTNYFNNINDWYLGD